jgi:gluconolactonase
VWLSGTICATAQVPTSSFSLEAKSPRFWEMLDKDAKLNQIASGFGFTEGPVWDAKGFLYVSDEEQNFIYRVFPDGRKEKVVALGDPDGNTYDKKHRLIDCASVLRAIIAVRPDGKYKVLADRFEGKKFNSPNDVVLGPDDALYFTDPTLDLVKGEKQELPYKGVFRLDHKGKLTLLVKDLDQPNGLAFSPDGKRLYVDDSHTKAIWIYDVGPRRTVTNGRLFGKEEGKGGPDGMRFDMQGNLYVTGPGGIWIWDTEGNHLGTIHVPEQPANLAWGGPNWNTLYLTAKTSVYSIQTKAHGFVPYRNDRDPK